MYPDHLPIIREFIKQVLLAAAEHEAEMVEIITKSAKIPDKPLSWKAAAWILEHGYARQNWFRHEERYVITETQEVAANDYVEGLSESEVLELVDPEWARLLDV